MAVINSTIKSSGGDYTSLAAWESDTQGDLVTAGNIEQAECFGFQDTTAVAVAGSTTDASNYRRIYAAAGAEAQSPYDTGGTAYNLDPSASVNTLIMNEAFLRVERIQARLNSGANGSRQTVGHSAGAAQLGMRCVGVHAVAEDGGNGTRFAFRALNRIQIDFINCIGECNDVSAGSGCFTSDQRDPQLGVTYYCTARGAAADAGFDAPVTYDTGMTVKNCLSFGPATGFTGTFVAASDFNAADDTTSPGGNSTDSISDPFVSSTDSHLASGSDVEGEGQDLSSDTDFAVSDDFDGVARDGSTPDVGAFEFVGAVAVVVMQPLIPA